MPGKPLFRLESEQARSSAWLGKIVLIRPVSFALLTACAFVMVAALATFFFFGEYTRKARVGGVLAPSHGVVKILAQQAAIVEAVHVREGDTVARHEALLVLGDGRTSRSHEDIGAAVTTKFSERQRALRQQKTHAAAAASIEQAGIEERKAGFAREMRQVEAEIAAQAHRTSIANQGRDRARALEDIGFLAAAGADREREAALEQQSRLEALRRSRLMLARELAALEFEAEAARARAEAQLAAIDMQRATTEQERLERDLLFHASIIAPAAGTVATVMVEPGQMVTAGTPLATLLPADATLEAHLFSPSRSIGFVRAGQEVLLRYLAYPHQKFGSHKARVIAVSRNPLPAAEMGFVPADGTREPLYRIKVALERQSVPAYGRAEALQPGMQVEADILLDRRRLIEWIFEPLLGLAGRA